MSNKESSDFLFKEVGQLQNTKHEREEEKMTNYVELLDLIQTISQIDDAIHSLHVWEWDMHQSLMHTRQELVRDLYSEAMASGYKVTAYKQTFILTAPMR